LESSTAFFSPSRTFWNLLEYFGTNKYEQCRILCDWSFINCLFIDLIIVWLPLRKSNIQSNWDCKKEKSRKRKPILVRRNFMHWYIFSMVVIYRYSVYFLLRWYSDCIFGLSFQELTIKIIRASDGCGCHFYSISDLSCFVGTPDLILSEVWRCFVQKPTQKIYLWTCDTFSKIKSIVLNLIIIELNLDFHVNFQFYRFAKKKTWKCPFPQLKRPS
jgi:hypothetical protein